MKNSFNQLFLANLKIVYRNRRGLFWTIIVPIGLYIALAVLPIPKLTDNLSYKSFVLPGVIAYVIMQGGIYNLAYWVVDLKAQGVIKRFLVTPIKNSELVLSLMTARLTVVLIQVVMITLIGTLFFHTTFAGNIFSTLLLVLLGGGVFLLVGLLISNYAGSYEAAAPLTAAIGMPLAFLGNIFFPIEILPKIFQIIAKILPITYLSDGLRQSFLYAFDFSKIGGNLLILLIWLIVLLLVTIKVFKLKE